MTIERNLMIRMASPNRHPQDVVDFVNLSIMEKVEVFEYVLENTGGQDLYKVLWLKSRHSEEWLLRRTAERVFFFDTPSSQTATATMSTL